MWNLTQKILLKTLILSIITRSLERGRVYNKIQKYIIALLPEYVWINILCRNN